jgi:hypothetical protein
LVAEQQLILVSRFSVLAWAPLVLAQAACSTSHGDVPCPHNQPAFHLELTAADGVLPDDTELTVGYEGILKEHYSLAKGAHSNVDLCCAPGEVVKGALPNVPCGVAHARDAAVIDPAPASEASVDPAPADEASVDPAPALDASVGRTPVLDASVGRVLDASVGRVLDASVSPMLDASSPPDAASRPWPTAIHCSIWTDNVADIEVTAENYAPYLRRLKGYVPDPRCGAETIDVRITLYHSEAGM